MIEISLLGPPRVRRDGGLVSFDTRKALALLAHLALTDRPRPRDALADLLWPDTGVERARGALRRTLSSLRTAIGAGRVEATRDHVRLVKDAGMVVDVDQFRALSASGTPGDLDAALALFRGDLLEGFVVRDAPDFEDWVGAEAEVLRRELTATLAAAAAARASAGNLGGAIDAVQRWLSLDALHEPAHQALIRLYADSGDRAGALVQYRECVRTLSRELGVPPLSETTALYEEINRGSYVPARAVLTRVPGPPSGPAANDVPGEVPLDVPLVGRAGELDALTAAYQAVGPDGQVAIVEGEAGIGKTRLAEEFVARARRRGARVLVARSHDGESGLAYAPVVEILQARLREGDDWLNDLPGGAVGEAARLVPGLSSGRGAGAPPEGPGAEIRFLSGLWDTIVAAVAGEAPGVLLLDDLQWADDATVGLLSYGLRRLTGVPVLVVLTWRTPYDHPLRRSAAASARAGSGTVVPLARLGPADVADLVQATRPTVADAAVARRLWETTEGVPLLLVEYLRTLGEDDSWPLPTGARDLLLSRLDPVSQTARQVLSAAAVIGRAFDVGTVRAVSGRTEEETVTALEEVVRRGLVRENPGDGGPQRGDYDFGHEQLRALVYEQTSLARRRLLHGRAAEVPGTPAAAVARHLHVAGRDAAAATAFRLAAEQARAVFANAEAEGHLSAALALGHPDRVELLTALGDVQTVMGDYAAALNSLEAAAAASSGDGSAQVEHLLGRLRHRQGEYALGEAHLSAAMAASSDPRAHASITADLSLTAASMGDAPRARRLAEEARALAERADDARSLCQAHNLLGMLATADADTDAALVHLRRSQELADEIDDPDLRVAARNNLALAHRARGELAQATDLTADALSLCTALGDRHREAALHNNLADLLNAAGRAEEAMVHLKAAVEIFADVGASDQLRPEIWKLVRW